MKTDLLCPACGFTLGFPPWDGDSPSDEICPSCGIQFGYDDIAGGNLQSREQIYERWRTVWVRNGMKWFSAGKPTPERWDPVKQLKELSLLS